MTYPSRSTLQGEEPGRPVIVGGGIAGLSVALAATVPVTLLVPDDGESTSTCRAQGGIAAAAAAADSAIAHARDTIRAGAGLGSHDVVEAVTQGAPDVITWLEAHGVVFNTHADGSHRLGLEGAHSHPRIHHCDGDGTGRVIHAALLRAARAAEHIDVRCGVTVHEVITAHGRVIGVRCGAGSTGDDDGVPPCAQAVLATGGYAAMYAHTTNPSQAWGSGIALAARAGATLQDLEMVQFHPTALDIDPLPLVSEAVRGAGARLVDDAGDPLVDDDLAARDVVAAAVFTARAAGRRTFLRLPAPLRASFDESFPAITASCRAHGLDPTVDDLPVTTAAHYTMGGIRTDADGATDVVGLFAVGECASSGLHGANRLASNSLLEGVALGRRVAARLEAGTPRTDPRESASHVMIQPVSARRGWPGGTRPTVGDPPAPRTSRRRITRHPRWRGALRSRPRWARAGPVSVSSSCSRRPAPPPPRMTRRSSRCSWPRAPCSAWNLGVLIAGRGSPRPPCPVNTRPSPWEISNPLCTARALPLFSIGTLHDV